MLFTCRKILSAPNLLRIDATENIFVECQDRSKSLRVDIFVKTFPAEDVTLDNTTVTLTEQNNFQAFGAIKIPANEFNNDPELKQHVVLEAKFSDGTSLKKVVLVSFQSGFIFIQTDKPLYTPNTRVHYRVFALTSDMKPINDKEGLINIHIVTPGNVVIMTVDVTVRSGMYSGSYDLLDIVSAGVWTVVVTFDNNKHHNYSSEFEVKEYVLPSFEVKVTANKNFFYVADEQLIIDIQAKYLFGKDVDGTAYVVFGIIDQNNEKHSFRGSIQRVLITKGKGEATLKRQHMLQDNNIEELVGSSIYVAVSVLTESGGETVAAEKQGIKIVKSPYTIHFKYTSKYFKPTMAFQVVVHVENPDGSPAPDVPLVVDPGQTPATTGENGIARVSVNQKGNSNHLVITARTNDTRISEERQTSATMHAEAYISNTKSYLHISVTSTEIKLGADVPIHITFNEQRHLSLTYLIQSRGQLVFHKRMRIEGQLTAIQYLRVTKEMLPSFRIIAYYQNKNEMVSDSVWVDVIDTCMGSLKLEETRKSASFLPRQAFRYKITGDPGATVGLVAVDKGVYALNNKHRLTQKKVWDTVEKADTGCTPGGGKNSMNVFRDAGLLFQNNVDKTDDREELKCPVSTRKKRESTILDVRTTLLIEYNDTLQRRCCLDGMSETPLSYSCERRKEYISDGKACSDAFFKCCQEIDKLRTESKTEALHLTRSENKNIPTFDDGQWTIRTKFPESWLWIERKLPLCSDRTTTCKTTSSEYTTVLQDTITTWHLTGISLSPTNGICVDDTLQMIVQKDFFIDLRLPYSVVRGEQIEIKAILHNYLLEEIEVQVQLKETEHVCSSASNKGGYTQTVTVGPESTRSVPFIIVPMEHGSKEIEIKAATAERRDAIRKTLKVVPRGTLLTKKVSMGLSPAKYKGKQVETITNPINVKDIVPNTPRSTYIYVTGGVQMLVEKVLDGSYMSSLIRQPSGCGEQNLAKMTLPIIAATYLDKTNQWDKVGTSKRDAALAHIKKGYQTQLTHRKDDGSFAIYKDYPSSSWLTAYAAKVFAMAYNLVDIDTNVLCGAIRWVISNSQKTNGMFVEIGQVYDGRIMGGMHAMDVVASTAFSLITMQEAVSICGGSVTTMTESINKAVNYLEGHLPTVNNPYAVAMVSYALAVANKNKFNKAILYKFASQDSTHWPVADHHLFTLEATSYALLALVKVKEVEDAAQIVKWLNTQTSVGGGYASTQSTTMVYQALAEYWAMASNVQNEMEIEIQVPGRSYLPSYIFNKQNAFQTRSTRNSINMDVNITAKGTGEATVSVVSLYYARPTAYTNLNNCEKFELDVSMSKTAGDGNEYTLKIEMLYRDMDKDAGMTILDIGLLTSYTADVEDLNKLSNSVDRTISKYEMNKVLSDRGSLIIYLDKVSHKQREEVAFKIRQQGRVGVIEPAAVSIYEYYEPKQCVTFYHPDREQGQIRRICQDDMQDVCTCAEEDCSMQKKGKIDNKNRKQKACDTEAKINYVYRVTMESYEEQHSHDMYMMRINQVIKEGESDKPTNELRAFLGYSHCREALGLKLNKSYLIMGAEKDTHKINQNQYEYMLGEQTWIEYWPTDLECQDSKYWSTCEGIDDLLYTFSTTGCKQ
ncbi:unnamed protein product [Merluccius merluccius]